ncbi:hypothetical protein B0H14DRAFT_3460150 [Mycena olivaceomarginata]|nr:hypothetical protein B0H14DRAFT_3460150 [Mycena olivaceomarginata]
MGSRQLRRDPSRDDYEERLTLITRRASLVDACSKLSIKIPKTGSLERLRQELAKYWFSSLFTDVPNFYPPPEPLHFPPIPGILPIVSSTARGEFRASVSPPPSTDRVVDLEMRAPSSFTFSSHFSDASVEDAATLRARTGGPPPMRPRRRAARAALMVCCSREAKCVLRMGGTMGGSDASGYEVQELDASDPDSDILDELQVILASGGHSPVDEYVVVPLHFHWNTSRSAFPAVCSSRLMCSCDDDAEILQLHDFIPHLHAFIVFTSTIHTPRGSMAREKEDTRCPL